MMRWLQLKFALWGTTTTTTSRSAGPIDPRLALPSVDADADSARRAAFASLPRDLHLGHPSRHARLQGFLPARLPAPQRVGHALPRRRHHRRLGAEEVVPLAPVAQRHRAEGAAQGAQGHPRRLPTRQPRRSRPSVRRTRLRPGGDPEGRRAHVARRTAPVGRARRFCGRRDAARPLARLRRRLAL